MKQIRRYADARRVITDRLSVIHTDTVQVLSFVDAPRNFMTTKLPSRLHPPRFAKMNRISSSDGIGLFSAFVKPRFQ